MLGLSLLTSPGAAGARDLECSIAGIFAADCARGLFGPGCPSGGRAGMGTRKMKTPSAVPSSRRARAGRLQARQVAVLARAHSSRDMRRRNLPDFLDTTVATVVKPALR